MKNKPIDRSKVLEAMIAHETLTITDLAKPQNLGTTPDVAHLKFLLGELDRSGHLQELPGVTPLTYTITEKGIEEGVRLRKIQTGDPAGKDASRAQQ